MPLIPQLLLTCSTKPRETNNATHTVPRMCLSHLFLSPLIALESGIEQMLRGAYYLTYSRSVPKTTRRQFLRKYYYNTLDHRDNVCHQQSLSI